MRISPTAYDHAFGNPSLAGNITTRMLTEEDSERCQADSLNLVRLLWRDEIPDIRRSVTAVNIYRTEYALHSSDNAPAAPVKESLLHTFPLRLFSEEGASVRQASFLDFDSSLRLIAARLGRFRVF